MAAPLHISKRISERFFAEDSLDTILKHLTPRPPDANPLPSRVPSKHGSTREGLAERRAALAGRGVRIAALANEEPGFDPRALEGNIENLIGFAKVPVGVIGPLRVNGAGVQGDFYVPLATNEGALVASYNRGCYAIGLAGGAAAACLTESVSRAPCFSFRNMADASRFLAWVIGEYDTFAALVAETSRHARLVDMKSSLIGKDLYLIFEYTTGDAAGQNMVTLATDRICRRLAADAPVTPAHWYIEGNFSGDKKATMLSFLYARGKKVIAETMLPRDVVTRVLHTTPEAMQHYWEISFIGGSQSGAIGSQGHFANALAALFIACGQDAACVSEASVGLTRMQVHEDGGLYVAVTLPNLIVGTVGGGTHLPTAQECLEMLGCYGPGRARAFAEICAATALAGEISIIGALAAGHFARAHAQLGRKRSRPPA